MPESFLTISSSCRAQLTSMVYLKRGMSMPNFSGLQTLLAMGGSVALSVGLFAAPSAVIGLCCLFVSAAMLGF